MLKRSLSFTDKVKFAAFLSKSFHLVRFQNDKLKKKNIVLSSIKNIMIFGLPEDSSKDLKRTVGDILEEIGLKPAMELSRDGKLKEKTNRPVKVTLSSSSTAYHDTRSSSKAATVTEL